MQLFFNQAEHIRTSNWDEVFETWRMNEHPDPSPEGWDKSWDEVAREQGYENWDVWRSEGGEKVRNKAIDAPHVYSILVPSSENIPVEWWLLWTGITVGRYQAWLKYYPDQTKEHAVFRLIHNVTPSMGEIARHPELQDRLFDKDLSGLKHTQFPPLILLKENEKLSPLDGQHRCVALASGVLPVQDTLTVYVIPVQEIPLMNVPEGYEK